MDKGITTGEESQMLVRFLPFCLSQLVGKNGTDRRPGLRRRRQKADILFYSAHRPYFKHCHYLSCRSLWARLKPRSHPRGRIAYRPVVVGNDWRHNHIRVDGLCIDRAVLGVIDVMITSAWIDRVSAGRCWGLIAYRSVFMD